MQNRRLFPREKAAVIFFKGSAPAGLPHAAFSGGAAFHRGLDARHQLAGPKPHRLGDLEKRVQRRAALAALDRAQMRPADPGKAADDLLRKALFLSHLLYTIYFASQMTLSFFWPLPLVLLVLGALLLAIIWTRLEEYRWPICTFIGMTLVMVWLAGELWFFRPTAPALSAFVGASLLFISNFVWLGSHYRRRFRADNAIAAACYFAGHFLIVRSLYL